MKHADTIEYLDAAIEMEIGILRLEEVSTKLNAEISERERRRQEYERRINDKREWELSQYEQKLDTKISDLSYEADKARWNVGEAEGEFEVKFAPKKKKKRRKKKGVFDFLNIFNAYGKGLVVSGIFLGTFLAVILIEMVIFGKKLTEDETLATYSAIVAIAIGLIAPIVFFILRSINKKKQAEALKKRISSLNGEVKRAKKRLEDAQNQKNFQMQAFVAKQDRDFGNYHLPKINGMKNQEQFLISQVTQNDLVLEKLYEQRKEFYSVGIVPPDYRYLDCVGVLRQIFSNDLADTMREAVLIYEERVFRGDLIRGIDKINLQLVEIKRNLRQMNVMMRFICEKLIEI